MMSGWLYSLLHWAGPLLALVGFSLVLRKLVIVFRTKNGTNGKTGAETWIDSFAKPTVTLSGLRSTSKSLWRRLTEAATCEATTERIGIAVLMCIPCLLIVLLVLILVPAEHAAVTHPSPPSSARQRR